MKINRSSHRVLKSKDVCRFAPYAVLTAIALSKCSYTVEGNELVLDQVNSGCLSDIPLLSNSHMVAANDAFAANTHASDHSDSPIVLSSSIDFSSLGKLAISKHDMPATEPVTTYDDIIDTQSLFNDKLVDETTMDDVVLNEMPAEDVATNNDAYFPLYLVGAGIFTAFGIGVFSDADNVLASDAINMDTATEIDEDTNGEAPVDSKADTVTDTDRGDGGSSADVAPAITPTIGFDTINSSGVESSAAELMVTLTAASNQDITVDYQVVAGTATGDGVDFTLSQGTLTISAGDVSSSIALDISNDILDESRETITVELSNPTHAILGTNAQHTYSINDDDISEVISLATLDGNDGFSINGVNEKDLSGWSTGTAGDFNGDGYADILIAAPKAEMNHASDANYDSGAVYMVFGKASGFDSSIDLANLDGSDGFVMYGDVYRQMLGSDHAPGVKGNTLSSAGDVNGDGIDDIVISAPRDDNGYGPSLSSPGSASYVKDAGKTYIIYGQDTEFSASYDLNDFNNKELGSLSGVEVNGQSKHDFSGISVSNAGDINGDGYADVIIGALEYFAGSSDDKASGESYIVFGGPDLKPNLDLANFSEQDGFIIHGANHHDKAGTAVSSAGDFNGDGYADLIVGAQGVDVNGKSNVGESYILFGSSDLDAAYDVSSFDGDKGFAIQGNEAGTQSGKFVSDAGDINGDGYADVLIGGHEPNHLDGTKAFSVSVVFGHAESHATMNLANLDGDNGFVIHGNGARVSSAGDFNADGYSDILIGAPIADPNGVFNAGESYIFWGGADGFKASYDLASLDGDNSIAIVGENENDRAGKVSSAGDIDGDGFADVLIGAPMADPNGVVNAGQSYVVFGQNTGSLTQLGTNGADELLGTDEKDVINGQQGDDLLTSGSGGEDVLIGGGGDDTIGLSHANFAKIEGGFGIDTLQVDIDLDFSKILSNKITGIEVLDVANNQTAQDVTLYWLSVQSMTEGANAAVAGEYGQTSNVLVVEGDAMDTLKLPDFTKQENVDLTVNGQSGYELFTSNFGNMHVVIDEDDWSGIE